MSILKSAGASRALRIGAALGVAGTALVGAVMTGGSAQATTTAPKATVAPATGPGGAGAAKTVLTLTASGFMNAAGVVQVQATNGVQFSAAACGTGPAATSTTAGSEVYNASTFAVPSATRIVATTAAAMNLGTSSAPKAYNVCVYSGSALLASGKFTAYAAPTITAANSPVSGSVAGGNTIVVTGTNFTKTSVVNFGTVVSPKVTVASNGQSLTAVVPAQAAGKVDVSVTTEGGTNATPGTATWDDYTYTNAITVTPQTGPITGGTAITISGVGFNALKAGFAAGTPTADVVFSIGQFDPTPNGSSNPTVPARYQCANPQVVSDTQLVCTTPNIQAAYANGATLTVQVVSDTSYTWAKAQAAGAGYTPAVGTFQTVLSSGSTFTFSNF